MNFDKLFELATPYLEKNDFEVAHTKRVFNIAKQNLRLKTRLKELTFASIGLHDTGGNTLKDQYEKRPQIAPAILEALDCPNLFIEQVCQTICIHHEPLGNPSETFNTLYDSDKLVMFSREEYPNYDSRRAFDWNGIITLLYSKQDKQLAQKSLVQRKEEQTKVGTDVF